MSVTAAPGATFYPSVEWGITGLTGTIGVRILKDSDGSTALARATAGISEVPATSGNYVATIVSPTTAGEYTILWDNGAVTPGNTATEDLIVTYSAAPAAVPSGTDLCTVAQVRTYLQKGGTETSQDAVIQEFVTAASAAIERYASREFAPRSGTLTRTFAVTGNLVDLMPYDLRTATIVTLDPAGSPVVLTADQYAFYPAALTTLGTYIQLRASRYTYLSNARYDSFGEGTISIAGSWGAASVPVDVQHAAIVTAGLWIRREVAARGSANPDYEVDGFDLRPLAIPGAAMRLIDPYRRTVYA